VDCEDNDCIRLSVPATPDAVRITRAGATGLATRAGFSYQEVEEVRSAVGEAAALLTGTHPDGTTEEGHSSGENGRHGEHDDNRQGGDGGDEASDTLVVVYALRPTGLSVELRVENTRPSPTSARGTSFRSASRATGADSSGTVPPLAAELLDASVDEWEVSTAARKVVLHKHRKEPDDED
jgi:hypothetical protein